MTIAEQRAAALDAANQIRIDRAKLRMRIGAGEVAAWKTIENPPACALSTTVFDYMTWLAGIGPSRGSMAFKLLRRARVASHIRIGELTDAQRARLVETLHDYAHPRWKREFNNSTRSAMRGENGTHPSERGLS